MTVYNSSSKRYWYTPRQGYEARSCRRLQIDLGVDDAVAESILRLRSQVLELQAQLRRLEVELAAQAASQNMHLTHYHDFIYEANWMEMKFQE